jgi:hypothetical protein
MSEIDLSHDIQRMMITEITRVNPYVLIPESRESDTREYYEWLELCDTDASY